MDETIYMSSNVGKRRDKVKKAEHHFLVFNGKKITLVSKIIIGRSRSCDVVLNDALVSRKHAVIQKIKDEYFIKDLNSKNGTYVNKKKVPDRQYIRLEKADSIKIGKNTIQLQ
ncbi:MAG: FHA domain-containing protein [Spirochaetales bacterium]|nr:FHA domain-containing protein [Spirochaetales bacterium]